MTGTLKKNERGFSLVEMLIVLAIFVIVIIITGQSFSLILKSAAKLFKSEESNIQGVVGLETLRHDLNQAGFGLATETGPAYDAEAAAGKSVELNDPLEGPPRPVAALERVPGGITCNGGASDKPDDQGYLLLPCSDYLTLKATNLGYSPAAHRWNYLVFDEHSVTPNEWQSSAENLQNGDSVVVLRNWIYANKVYSTLEPSSGKFYHTFGKTAFNGFTSAAASTMNIYGVDTGTLKMPFNRADYFVAKPSDASLMSASCASGTGVLYKATLNQSDGKLTYMPLIDCVADMQVVFAWDTDNNGSSDTWTNADGTSKSGPGTGMQQALTTNNDSLSSVLNIRNNLKMIKVYILAQDGRRDPEYVNQDKIRVGDEESNLINTVDVTTAEFRNYRWKLYRIFASPKNLNANQ